VYINAIEHFINKNGGNIMQAVYDFLKKANTYFLATTDGSQPRVRPFGTVDIYGGKLYIQTGRKKDCYRQMKANPRIEICAMSGGEWIRISAIAVEDTDIEAERHMLAAYPELQGMYKPGDGNNVVFYLTDATATISSFTKPPVTIKF
jgi:uncharacterized pyridoxamine 5'-phosphate oxidase family protein